VGQVAAYSANVPTLKECSGFAITHPGREVTVPWWCTDAGGACLRGSGGASTTSGGYLGTGASGRVQVDAATEWHECRSVCLLKCF